MLGPQLTRIVGTISLKQTSGGTDMCLAHGAKRNEMSSKFLDKKTALRSHQQQRRWALGAVPVMLLNACGGGGGGGSSVASSGTPSGYGNLNSASLGAGAPLNGAIPFPADNAWNTDISGLPVDQNSANLIANMGASTHLHADFGAPYNGLPLGIPYLVVSGTEPLVNIDYGTDPTTAESDAGPFPIPLTAPIEGGSGSTGDRHVLVIDRDHNRLYELFGAYPQGSHWTAGSGALFDLSSNNVRPGGQAGWTSADAAGLPIFPGLARYEEAVKGPGGIRHALRFTVQNSRKAYVPPATHYASNSTDTNRPPMGMRVRLKASYHIPDSFSTETKALLQAMKTYGMIVADNGSSWYISGAPDDRWDNDTLSSELGQVTGSEFEVVQMTGLVTG
jgi:hypothetical protein